MLPLMQKDGSSIKIKFCGMNSPEAVRAAAQTGADYLGFIFVPRSPRYVTPEAAAALLKDVPAAIHKVAVTVNATDEEIDAITACGKWDFVQLHGHETPQRVEEIRQRTGLRIIKALPVAGPEDVRKAEDYFAVADALLFDTKPQPGEMTGGTGRSFDWSLVAGRVWPLPWFVSGGLSPENAGEALRISGAPAVDVSSGIESAPGVKDPEKIRRFAVSVRAAFTPTS